ncbi:hypothetical protein [Burkholderia thailandensis]|uniref:Uncharacterized protein n=1 Tax=Burkholderia thailandensis (strain ATCC 700388 / DSM 13276 / CCUG 48851 / CIP 106301 / E264) TaxID=271848 RepID=Q2T3Q8_BURTA|nr:hypothetical protein [Burkholderia thailandensis]ABC34587.1 hypothetical protein BTH_II1997 [Burkholderia thailandensis E264]AVR07709.1 hypothetical protein A8H31_09750 [Burkholderia thailandensis]AWY60939.1 hypothetical protein A8H35_21805 [Burkholderia thailandensis]AWY64995.1 hypothetical protein A8H36_06855 [Burkholderia thailandensis]MBS2130055.1 hypothetical protein [Burkholderia thailandensis]
MVDMYALTLPVLTHPWLEGESPLQLAPDSPRILLRSVEKLAHYFKREMHFDFVQFDATETKENKGFVPYQAYAFFAPARDRWQNDKPMPHRVFGACCFRDRDSSSGAPSWSLDWVWMHPYFRHCGHLKEAWPMFEREYGEGFHVEEPVSLAMRSFMEKYAFIRAA